MWPQLVAQVPACVPMPVSASVDVGRSLEGNPDPPHALFACARLVRRCDASPSSGEAPAISRRACLDEAQYTNGTPINGAQLSKKVRTI